MNKQNRVLRGGRFVLILATLAAGTGVAAAQGIAYAVLNNEVTATLTPNFQFNPSGGTVTAPKTGTLVSLAAGQQIQFTASLVGAPNTAVSWSVSPAGLGTIDSNGNYTAPAALIFQQSVNITATSQQNPSQSSTVQRSSVHSCPCE